MRKHYYTPIQGLVNLKSCLGNSLFVPITLILLFISNISLNAQCVPASGRIKGEVYKDNNINGALDATDVGIPFIQINAYDKSNLLVASAITDLNGLYTLSGLQDGAKYRVEIIKPQTYEYSYLGLDNKGELRIASPPACEIHFALYIPNDIVGNPNPDMAIAIFNKTNNLNINGDARSIISLKQSFLNNSAANTLSKNGQTGSIYGLAWNKSKSLLYASAFVKQFAVLGSAGLGGIYTIDKNYIISNFLNLESNGINLGSTNGLATDDCNYGSLVGKTGLGNLDISDDDNYLFTTNLFNRSLLIIPTNNPNNSNIIELSIPNPGCSQDDYVVSAVKYYHGYVYLGVTCTSETNAKNNECSFHVYELNLLSRVFNEILATGFAKEYWLQNPKDSKHTSQWLTDIDFNNRGEMILGIADRKGHTYCSGDEPLTNQEGDILVAFKSGNQWILENGGIVNGRGGSGVGHYEGPGLGEFFGEDYWLVGPSLHPEVSFGTLACARTAEVINAVFDPRIESFAGGLHRYNTDNGKLISSFEIYNRNNNQYGKSTGIGDIEIMNEPLPLEIGNLIWNDLNKNGVQDCDEVGMSDIQISLYSTECKKIATTKTDISGNYLFNNKNVDLNGDGQLENLNFGDTYLIVIDDSRFDPVTKILSLGQNKYDLSPDNVMANGLADSYDSDGTIEQIGICEQLKALPLIVAQIGNSGQNQYNFDFGFQPNSLVVNPPVITNIVDLALIKKINSPSSLKLNDYVDFSIEVYNQGNVDVDYYEVIDYIPLQFEFVNAQNLSWTADGSNAIYKSTKVLKAGEHDIIAIKLKLINTIQVQSIINVAEIAAIKDKSGIDLKDIDSNPDKIKDNDAGGVVNSATDNLLTGDGINDEDDQDPANLSIYDLALILTTTKNTPAKINEDVTFQVRICNQGSEIIKNTRFIDYVPSGLSLSPFDNNGWMNQNSKLYNTINSEIKPGECATKEILLRVGEVSNGNCIVNRAEIVSYQNLIGINASNSDIDSKADEVNGNDAGGVIGSATDNFLGGNGINDEDDEDPEQLLIADLALRKILRDGSVLKYKGNIIYDISIFNQGCVSLKNIKIADYLPQGFALSSNIINNGWVDNSGILEYTSNTVLNPGDNFTIPVELSNVSDLNLNNLSNIAEIASFMSLQNEDFSAYDYDSNPDENPTNDNGAVIGTSTDDQIDDHGSIDEDDHDIATIPLVDLALQKTIIDGHKVFKVNDVVEFKIRLVNQGNITSSTVNIVDYIDKNFTFPVELNQSWQFDGNSKAYYTLSQDLNPGESIEIPIKLVINVGTFGLQIPNNAEITSIRNAQNFELVDFDSNQDELLGNDKYDKSRIDDHGDLDEDDHDRAVTNPNNFDLTLRKYVDKRVVQLESEVEWTIDIVNQGSIAATMIEVVDYLPEGLSIKDNNWEIKNPSFPNKYYQTLSTSNGKLGVGGLLPKDTLRITILTMVNSDAVPGIITNGAEISAIYNDLLEVDDDSTPDDIEDNDPGGTIFDGTDKTASAGPDDEDDEDDADVEGVFYLRLEHSDCYCLNNATIPGNGQYSTELTLESRNDEVWFIKSVNGLYQTSSPAPPLAPTPFTTGPSGETMIPISFTGLTTIYSLTGIFQSGIGFDIIVENQYGDKVNIGNVRCTYEQPIVIEAQNNVCIGSTVRYSLKNNPLSTYLWTLGSGGTIISDPTKNGILVNWTGLTGSTHTLTVKETNSLECLEPIDFPIVIGSVAGSISCIGNAQISLNANCQATVTAKQLLVGGPYDYNSYAVMIFNKDGSLVPNATVDYSQVGKKLTAKVINTCNGNSCWTNLTVEDKLAPIIVCLNDTIDCTRMKSHLGPFIYDNCDPNPTKTLLSETIENTPCNSLYSKIVHRKYVATDASGNTSKPCYSDYFLKRIILDSIIFPDSLLVIDRTALSCGHYPKDSLGRPLPSYTGLPIYHNAPIWPNNDSKYCDYAATFDDYIISNNDCTKKINRVWKFTIWYCTTFQMKVYNQIIEIKDYEAPVFMCPYDKEVFTQSASCDANVFIAPLVAIDSCNNGVHITLHYPGGFIKDFKGDFVKLPLGLNELWFEVYDNCYNTDYCTFFVDVIDKAAPIAQCDKETVVSLDRFGQAWVPANVFNDGSYDNCHLKSMQALRMDNGLACNFKTNIFADTIGFCCADIGKLITIMFKVTDESGNSNTCMIQVEVQDKTIPHVTCPHDLTIDCDYHFDPKDLSEFGMAHVSDNCDVTYREVDSFYINQCNEGYIERIFIAGNSFGMDVCTQRITIINSSPFTEMDIIWPRDFDTTTCSASSLIPSLLDKIHNPIITEDHCDLVGVNYKDEVFKFVSGTDACFKILRKWSVINWCRFRDVAGNPIIYEHTQIIKSYNKVKPIIRSGCQDQRVEITDTSCLGGNITLIATADDDCTPTSELVNEYLVDLDSDGRYEIVKSGVGGIINASGYYKLGKHRIKYVFEDRCGNKEVCEINFELINAKLPVAYCRKGLAVGIEPMDLNGDGKFDGEFATIWAKDFDQGSYHPCKYDLTYSIGRDSSKHSITYDCDSIGRRTVLLCVTATNGKQDCCETFIEVQDNNQVDLCGCLKKPLDLTVNSCEQLTDPTSINSFPRFGLCECDSSKISFNDVIIDNIPNLCYRIQRNWVVEFTCANGTAPFNFIQNIDVTTNLRDIDILWPSDSVVVDNCDGSIDTADIGEVPRFCTYAGRVMVMYSDVELPSVPNTRLFRRTWNVFSKCVIGQSFFFEQNILVVNPIGTKIKIPADIVVNSCSTPFLPDSLNGYPTVACGCDSIIYDYKDDTIVGNPEICYLVERNWIVHIKCRPQIDTTFIGIQRITRDVNLDPNDIIWPQDTFKSFTCVLNNNPDRTGRPQLKKSYCGLVTFMFMDLPLQGATCNTIQRTWIAKNSCSATQTFSKNQFLISFNQGSISLTCPPNLTVDADPNTCGAIVTLSPPTILSPCNFGVSLTNNAPSVYPVGKTNVVFTAIDSCNHVATCTTMVTVIENVPPTLICPIDTIVDCSVNTTDLNQFGIATASDNCPGVTLKDSVLRNQNICGIGSIVRYFIATDASGNRTTCLQNISIVNNDPLDSLEINWPLSPITVDECAPFDFNNTGIPTIAQGAASCFKVSISSTDTAFCLPGLCEVDRKWTVFDTCSNNTFMFVQRIIRNDTIPPTILGVMDTLIFANDTSCSGFVSLKAFVNNCDSDVIVIINDSQFGGNGKEDASGFYPQGETTVKFTAFDGCCNMAMLSIKITVVDTVPPEITCKKVVKSVQDNGCAEFNANEFVVIKTDNCSPPAKIMASFNKNDFNDTIRTICCDSIKGGQFTMIITVYYKDEAGNITQCQTLLQAIDDKGFCGTFTSVAVHGLITSRKDKNMVGVPVDLVSDITLQTATNFGGYYAFPNMALGGSYTVKPELDIDYLDGVSTYDIVLIQQHILGKKSFVNPYQYIAADVNNSKSVTSADISDIRKLILGTTENFRNNKSWRFVKADYIFANPTAPLTEKWPETGVIPVLQDNTFVSFKGIKIGDVDDSQKFSNFDGNIKSRSNETAELIVSELSLKQGTEQMLTVSLKDCDSFIGAQAALFVDPSIAEIMDVKFDDFSNITEEALGLSQLNEGIIKISWARTQKSSDFKLNITLKSKQNINAINAINLSQKYMVAEAYSVDYKVLNLELRSESQKLNKGKELVLYQNIPNPFSLSTKIPFEINSDSDISLEIYDINSRIVYQKKAYFKKGYHEIEINKSNLQKGGLYYYQIHTATEHINKRMLMID
ncbi:MAG: SdrD B-like domain-containing protein [Saprospiraceae bacterium]